MREARVSVMMSDITSARAMPLLLSSLILTTFWINSRSSSVVKMFPFFVPLSFFESLLAKTSRLPRMARFCSSFRRFLSAFTARSSVPRGIMISPATSWGSSPFRTASTLSARAFAFLGLSSFYTEDVCLGDRGEKVRMVYLELLASLVWKLIFLLVLGEVGHGQVEMIRLWHD